MGSLSVDVGMLLLLSILCFSANVAIILKKPFLNSCRHCMLVDTWLCCGFRLIFSNMPLCCSDSCGFGVGWGGCRVEGLHFVMPLSMDISKL